MKNIFPIVLIGIVYSSNMFAQDIVHLNTYFRNLKTVNIFIQGEKYNFLFDSGGGQTFISPEIAKLLNKKIYGNSTGFRMNGEIIKYQKADSVYLSLDSTELFHKTIGVWDIMSVLPKELPKIDGVISLKSFSNNILTINLSKNILIIDNINSSNKQIKGKTLIPSRFANGPDGGELDIFIGIPKDNLHYWFLFDTGNIRSVILSPNSALLWDIKSNAKNSDLTEDNLDFMLGQHKVRAKAVSEEIIFDGALDYNTISKYIFTIDFRNKEVWIN